MGKLNLSQVDKVLNMENSAKFGGNDYTYDKLLEGKNIRRILFPKGDNDMFFADGFMHYGVGEGKKSYVCASTKGDPCPICAALYKLKDSKNPDDVNTYNQCRKKRRIAINVLDVSESNPQPKVLYIGATVLKGILQTITDPDYGDITDPETGREVTIIRSGQGLQTTYNVVPKPDQKPLKNADEIEKAMADLNSLFTVRPHEELEEVAKQISPLGNGGIQFNPISVPTNNGQDTALGILNTVTTSAKQ